MNTEIKLTKKVRKLRHGNTHTEYRNDERSVLVEQDGIGWSIYRNGYKVAGYGSRTKALDVARSLA